MTQKQTGSFNKPSEKDCLLFLSGCGDGYGYGDDNGNGNGDSYSHGDGYGNGDSHGNGDSYGYGDGDGGGYGYGNGDSYGNGDGYGNGCSNGGSKYKCWGIGNSHFKLEHPNYKVDDILCRFLHIHGDYAKVLMLDMYNSELCKIAYIAKEEGAFAHGETLKEARESLLYKLSDRDTSPYKDWKLSDVKTKKELIKAYRAITGACEFGTRHFCESVRLPNKTTVAKAIELTKGQYGNETFRNFFEED